MITFLYDFVCGGCVYASCLRAVNFAGAAARGALQNAVAVAAVVVAQSAALREYL